jgi:drug/metabolite transporter (DMT)-like permease
MRRSALCRPPDLTFAREVISVSMSQKSNDTPVGAVALPRAPEASAFVWCLLGVVGFSLSLPATRAAVPEIGVLPVTFGRACSAGLLALVVLVWKRERLPKRHQLLPLALVALGVAFGFPLCTAVALAEVPSTHATVIIGLVPAATALYAVMRNGERPSLGFWLAAFAGAVAVVVFGASQGSLHLAGADLWLLAAVAFAALGYAEGARLSSSLGGWRVISWALVLGLPFSLAGSIWAWPTAGLHPGPRAVFGFGYISLVSMYLAFFAWYRGLASGSIARGSQIQLVQPVLSLGWAALWLGEEVGAATLVASLVVVGCAAWARSARVTPRPVG